MNIKSPHVRQPFVPNKIGKNLEPYLRFSYAHYQTLRNKLVGKITTYEAEVASGDLLIENVGELIEAWKEELERLEAMDERGMFVPPNRCNSEGSAIDWTAYNKERLNRRRDAREQVNSLFKFADTDEQRAVLKAELDSIDHDIKDLTTKTLTVDEKKTVIERVLARNTK